MPDTTRIDSPSGHIGAEGSEGDDVLERIFITPLEAHAGGVRLAVKDLLDTAGVRTTYGSALFAEHVPSVTAESVARLEAGGYSSVGKANLHEFAWGVTSENDHYGWVPNPLARDRVAGGSSGGCGAALAAGLADAALGTDSGGSIRVPAACCGIVGFKPTFGLVPIHGCFPLAVSFDHVGPMGRDVETCEQMLGVLAPSFAPASTPDLGDLRVGAVWLAGADPIVRRAVERAIGHFGTVVELDLPSPVGTHPLFSWEVAVVHRTLFAEHPEKYGESVAAKLEQALRISDAEATAARRACELYRERIAELTQSVDLLLSPTLEMVAPPSGLGDLQLRGRMLKLTYPHNVTGSPALALPCGAAEGGLPASVQLSGGVGQDALILAAGRALEQALKEGAP